MSAGCFNIDRRMWSAVCDLGDFNAAIAYLVLGCGTGRSNSETRWSAQALMTWTDMPRRKGKEAIAALVKKGFIVLGARHTSARPLYELLPWKEDELGPPSSTESRTELIWLPNSLITGTSSGEMSPLKKLRLAGDIWPLRLLVDLYHVHHLESDSGVLSDLLRQDYSRLRVGEQGAHTVWGFAPDVMKVRLKGSLKNHADGPREEDGSSSVWSSIEALEKMGLISFVPHLYPNSRYENPIHSLGKAQEGAELEEEDLRNAAYAAAEAMLQPEQINWAYCEGGYELLVPAPNWMKDVQVRGVVRLRYRPHTNPTSQWLQALRESVPDLVSRYTKLRDEALDARPARRGWRNWSA